MPRRPRKQPRTSTGVKDSKRHSRSARKTDGRLPKWNERKDIQGNEEDQFHETRDRIMLEGEDVQGNEEWGDGEEEVFGLDLDDDSGSEKGFNDESGDADTNEADEDDNADIVSSPKPKKTKKKISIPKEVSPSQSDAESDESESWGRKKSAYYASNAGLLAEKEGEEDEEEANEMEEHEARRLQARMRETLEDEDYGLDDKVNHMENDALLEDDHHVTVSQNTSLSKNTLNYLDRTTALRHLEKMDPETLALTREWGDVAGDLMNVQQRLVKLESISSDLVSLALSHLHHQILLTYITNLAFYLHLRAGLPMAPQSVNTSRVKPVLERLLILKQALSTMEELDFDDSESDGKEDQDDFDLLYLDEEERAELERLFGSSQKRVMKDVMDGVSVRKASKSGVGELQGSTKDVDAMIEDNAGSKFATKPASVNGGVENHSKKYTKGSQKVTLSVKTPVFDLEEPTFVPSKRGGTRSHENGLEAYGESTTLSVVDDTDKKARKRSLRFHTNKIETSARRREEGRAKLGGDDDIPYRERKKEKEARVRREVERTRGEGGDDLDVIASPDEHLEGTGSLGSGKRKRDDDDPMDEEDEEGYYELVKRAKKERQQAKKREYEEARMKGRMDIVEDNASGPRSLTRAILKNKGLTPWRSKSGRNPRVKKRERFEKAKKKVRSQKAVYKGGLSGRPYGGEESGITKVVKSVKL